MLPTGKQRVVARLTKSAILNYEFGDIELRIRRFCPSISPISSISLRLATECLAGNGLFPGGPWRRQKPAILPPETHARTFAKRLSTLSRHSALPYRCVEAICFCLKFRSLACLFESMPTSVPRPPPRGCCVPRIPACGRAIPFRDRHPHIRSQRRPSLPGRLRYSP